MNFDQIIDSMKADIIISTQEIIQYESTEDKSHSKYPFGEKVHQTLLYALDLAQSMGFKTKNVDNYAGYAEYGTGDEMIGVLVHLDVVPAGNNWTTDPFGGEVIDQKIYGRGSTDNKGPAIAALYAIKALIDSKVPLQKRIRVIFGLNEETHWESIKYYMAHEEVPSKAIVPDSDFPVVYAEKGLIDFNLKQDFYDHINDGGIEIISITGGTRSNVVPDYAEATIISKQTIQSFLDAYNKDFNSKLTIKQLDEDQYLIMSRGVSAHSSLPETGSNAIAHLINFLDKLDIQIGDSSNFIRAIARHIGLDYNGENIGCSLEDEDTGKLTFNIGVIKMDQSGVELQCNVRYPVKYSLKEVIDGIKKTLDYTTIEISDIEHINPLFIDKDTEFIQSLTKIYNEYTGRNDLPTTMGGATYARSMPNAVAFGAAFPWQEELAHQKNEYIAIDDLILATKIYAKSLYDLTK